MHLVKKTSVALCFLCITLTISAQTLYNQPCPILNLNYPALSSYASSDVIQSAMSALKNNITRALNQSTIYGQLDSQSNAFSIDVYSLRDEVSLFNYDYTPDALMSQYSVGVRKVDSNTIYRIGSISKVLTVYIYLISAGDGTWNQPITNFVPELAAYAQANQQLLQTDKIDIVDWSSITIGALASHMAGIARETTYSPAFERALQSIGLPSSTRNESAECGDDTIKAPCDRKAFFNDFLKQRPLTSPFVTPFYSNVAFQILGYAIENITGKSMSDLFTQDLVQRLNLNSTYYTVPPSPNTSFVPINTTASLWSYNAGDEGPTGGYFTSINDMRKIGKSILNFTLITPAQTRRWMKPRSFTSTATFAIGAPWEITRAPGDLVSWIYSKTGAFGAYGGIIAFLPEYNIGLTVLAAGFSTTDASRIISDIVVESVVPAVYAAAKAAAVSTYTGTYLNSTTNSTITISTPDAGPGLTVSNWTVNGTQVIPFLGSLLGVMNQTTQSLSVTLYPTGLTSTTTTNNNNTSEEVSWRASFRVLPQPSDTGAFSEDCVSWGSANTVTYSGVGFDEFLFGLGQNGTAVSVEPRVFGLEFARGMMVRK